MSYYITKEFIIVRKHWLVLFSKLLKFIMLILISILLYWLANKYSEVIWKETITYIIFPSLVIIFTASFIKLIFIILEHYSHLFIIHWDKVILTNSTFILRNDIEVIDIYRIMKFDAYSRWFISNILWYGSIVIEQQKDEVREIHFLPTPYRIIGMLTKQRQKILEDKKRKYLIEEYEKDV